MQVFQHDVETGKRTAFIRRGEQPDGQPPEAPAGKKWLIFRGFTCSKIHSHTPMFLFIILQYFDDNNETRMNTYSTMP